MPRNDAGPAPPFSSLSFGVPEPCVEGNVVRILARLTADATEFRDSASASQAFRPLAQSLVPTDRPGDHNQAMMELGATVCFRQKPLCLTCPVRPFCAGAQRNPEQFPRLAAKRMEKLEIVRVWCIDSDRLLLHRTPASARRLANLHELPSAEQAGLDVGEVRRGERLATRRRGITRYQITELIHRVPPTFARRKLAPDLVWVSLVELESVTLSGPHRRWVKELLAQPA